MQIRIETYLGMEIPAFGCGLRVLTARVGRKHVRVKRSGKRRAHIIPRRVWDALAARARSVERID